MLRSVLGAVAIVVVLGACGGGDDDAAPSTTTATSEPSTTVETFGGVPGAAQSLACEQSVRTLQQASDFYAAMHGAPAPSLDALLTDGSVTSTSSPNAGYVLGYDAATGKVSATGACTI